MSDYYGPDDDDYGDELTPAKCAAAMLIILFAFIAFCGLIVLFLWMLGVL